MNQWVSITFKCPAVIQAEHFLISQPEEDAAAPTARSGEHLLIKSD